VCVCGVWFVCVVCVCVCVCVCLCESVWQDILSVISFVVASSVSQAIVS